jgi:hypothetical protein
VREGVHPAFRYLLSFIGQLLVPCQPCHSEVLPVVWLRNQLAEILRLFFQPANKTLPVQILGQFTCPVGPVLQKFDDLDITVSNIPQFCWND